MERTECCKWKGAMVQGREVEVVKLICGAGKEKGKYWAYKWRWWSEDGEENEPTKLCMK